MAVALIAAAITLVVVIVIIVVVFALMNRRKSSNVSVKKEVHSIESIGVASSLGDSGKLVGSAPVSSAGGGNARRPSASPAESVKPRFVAMGVLAATVFGSLTAKLFSMQVLSWEQYRSDAEQNRFTTVSTPAPRGFICDADGLPLVRNRLALTILADPDVASDRDVVLRLSAVLGVPTNVVRQRIQDATSGAQAQRVVASDVRLRDAAFIAEHSDAFPGVIVDERTVRDYPYGALAAHAIGYTGTVGSEELATAPEGRDIQMGDDVGKSGVEQTYDNYLAGDHGTRRVVADADGNIVEVVSETQPTKGSDVWLTIKGPVQYVCDRALAQLVAPDDGTIGTGKGTGAAAVVLDARDGGIVAMASYPTFDPASFTGGISANTWDVYTTAESYYPMFNRAIQGEYPAASTYKPFTGIAALKYGFADTKRTWSCGGSWDGWNTGQPQKCWLPAGHGTLDFRGGIVQSCDVVFYDIAKQFWDNCPLSGNPAPSVSNIAMQEEVEKYRFGQSMGIDLTGEAVGRVPTPEWKAEYFADFPEDASWRGGDMTNMVIGQGYVLVTPLQVACAYAGLATGTIMQPHLFKEVHNNSGDAAVSFEPKEVTHPDVPDADLAVIRDALRGVATDNADIATLFAQAGISDAACKTGTAEYTDQGDTAWFACYAPHDNPKYVVACVVEHGGGGSAVAAPLGVELLSAALAADAGTLSDMGRIAGSTGKSTEDASTANMSGRTD